MEDTRKLGVAEPPTTPLESDAQSFTTERQEKDYHAKKKKATSWEDSVRAEKARGYGEFRELPYSNRLDRQDYRGGNRGY